MARKYNMTKRLDKAYANYKSRYKKKEASLKKKGYNMVSRMLTKREYMFNRQAYVNEGVTTNINQTMVSEQAYEYSQKTARRFKKTAQEHNLKWKDKSIMDIMKGDINVSEINEWLKETYIDWTGMDRQKWISHEVFGSE